MTDGSTFNEERDGARIARQRRAVFALMSDGKTRTLDEIATATGYPEASISARLRDFRKKKYGEHTVEKAYLSHGLWLYRLIVREEQAA
jgi:hypothetical protein